MTVTQGEGAQSRSDTDTLTVTVTSIQTTGPRGANNTEREALKLTFGEAVGEFLIGQIIIKFPDGLTRAIVPYTVNNETNVREMHLTGDHDLANLGKLGTFIHEAAHIWQRNTELDFTKEKPMGITIILSANSSPLSLNVEEYAQAVQEWFIANYAYTHGLIGDGPGQVPASFFLGPHLTFRS